MLARVGGTAAEYRTGVADENGRFVFHNLIAGSYRVYAERQGYLGGEHGRRAANVPGTPVVVVEGQSLAAITIAMIPTGVITGRVLDDGRPATNVWVRAMRAVYPDGERVLNITDYARTDDRGEYRIFGLPPAAYFVSAVPPDKPRIEGDAYIVRAIPSNANRNQSEIRINGQEALASGQVDPVAFGGGIYLPVFHPNTTDPAAAAAVEVRPGATVAGIDLAVARATTVHVRGRVTNGATGRPAGNASVSVAPQENRGVAPASAPVSVTRYSSSRRRGWRVRRHRDILNTGENPIISTQRPHTIIARSPSL